MARSFTPSTDKLQVNTAVISGTPFTMCAWFDSNSITANQQIIGVFDDASDTRWYRIQAAGAITDDPVRAQIKSSADTVNVDTSTGYSANVWNHACLVAGAGDNDWAAFLNGSGKGTSTTSVTPDLLDNTSMGLRTDSVGGAAFDGELAEAAIWNVALTDEEVASLAAGFSPLLIRPQSLVSYWPIIGRTSPEIDIVGANNMTVTGAVVSNHPRVIYPTQPMSGFAAAAAGPAPNVFAVGQFGQPQPVGIRREVVPY